MSDKETIDHLTETFFKLFTNTEKHITDWNLIFEVCINEAIIIKKTDLREEIYNLQNFIEPRMKILSEGILTEFEEKETEEDTLIIGNIAQRWSKYQKHGYLNGIYFQQTGNKLFHFIKIVKGWKISSLLWEDNPI
ncbi:MAG TPA: hypothetical protein VK590_15505 [Saprospiraceae bacterium]|nr:hypothetical protein [Saprospiraceae bacterium]